MAKSASHLYVLADLKKVLADILVGSATLPVVLGGDDHEEPFHGLGRPHASAREASQAADRGNHRCLRELGGSSL